MQISSAGLALIKRAEGLRLEPYLDRPNGVWTIGYGSTRGVTKGQVITPGEAERLLIEDLERHDIGPLLGGCATMQREFDAMTSLAFNIGLERFRNSTVLKRHRLGNKMGAANAFLLWRYDNGKVVPGLLHRREAEREMYLGSM